MADIKLKNTANTEFSISHNGTRGAKAVTSDQIVVAVETINAFPANAETGDTVIVKDNNRGGTFIYDDTQSAVNNGGTIFYGWTRQYSGAVNVKWFGAKGDGINDDTDAINNAITYFAKDSGLVDIILPSATYYIPGTIYLVSNMTMTIHSCILIANKAPTDFNDQTSVPMFETGYLNGDTIVSNISTGNEVNRVTKTSVLGEGTLITYAGTGFNLKNFNEGSSITGFRFNECGIAINSRRGFYSSYSKMIAVNHASFTGTEAAYIFYTFNNVIECSSLFVSHRLLGFKVTGPNSAFKLLNCSTETVTNGISFIDGGNAGPVEIDSCYFEFITGKSIEFSGSAHEVVNIKNCWFHSTLYALYATGVQGGKWVNNKLSNTGNNEIYDQTATDLFEIKKQDTRIFTDVIPTALPNINLHSNIDASQMISVINFGSSTGIARGKNYVNRIPELQYTGDSGVPQNRRIAFCTTTLVDLGGGNYKYDIDTGITHRSSSMMVGYVLQTTDGVGSYNDVGFILGYAVVRSLASSLTISISNNNGFLRITIAGLNSATLAGNLYGSIRLL